MRPERDVESAEGKAEQAGAATTSAPPVGPLFATAAPGAAELPECRICLETDNQPDMVSPCACHGTMQHAHLQCLKHWAAEKRSLSCELCGQEYAAGVRSKLEPVVAAAQQREASQGFYTTYITLPLPSEGAPPPTSWTRFWLHVALLTALLIGVLYVALFVNISGMDNFWVLFFWRVLTVVLPLFLIGRTIIALHHWRRQANAQRVLAVRIARAQERRAHLQERLQERLQQLSNMREQQVRALQQAQQQQQQQQQQRGGQQGQQQMQHAVFIF